MKNENRIKKGFDFLAPFYDAGARLLFGTSLLSSQTYFIPQLGKVKSALIVGGGTGKILTELLKHDTAESYCYLDISEKMIEKSKKRVLKIFPKKIHQIAFECGSYEKINAGASFDLILTPYILDCLGETEIKEVMTALHKKLSGKGKWLMVDFNIPVNPGLMPLISTIVTRFLYIPFNIICGLGLRQLPDFSKHFSDLKLSVWDEKYFLGGMLTAKIYQKQ